MKHDLLFHLIIEKQPDFFLCGEIVGNLQKSEAVSGIRELANNVSALPWIGAFCFNFCV